MRSLHRRFSVFVLACVSVALASCSAGDGGSPFGADNRAAIGGGGGGGFSWTPMPSPTTETLWGVWGSPDEVIAVGNVGTAIHLVDAWLPKNSGTSADLCDVWTDGESRAFAVGLGGTILRYRNGAWSAMESGTSANLNDVFGFEDGTAVAVGQAGTILWFDGRSWSPMTSVTDVNLFGSWGSAADDLFAVGVGGTIVHYDGSAWGFMTTVTPENLSAVFGNSGTDVWAVGDAGSIIHFDGTSWLMSPCGTSANFADVWTTPDELWAVGANGTILHYDLSLPSCAVIDAGTEHNLLGVWGRSRCEIYAVGAAGTILRYGPDENEGFRTYLCHDHPQGAVAPPTYGLRLDDLIGEGRFTFSFDYSDGVESARVELTYDEALAEIRIRGRAYGGRVENHSWASSARGWIDIDFTYRSAVSVFDNCRRDAGDDLYVTGASSRNNGAVTLDGWGGNASFSFHDRADEAGCSFIFDNDWDSKGVAEIAEDPAVWSAAGWLQPGTSGQRDWVFTATRIFVPTECK